MSAHTGADLRRVMDTLGCFFETDDLTNERYCLEHNAAWLSDIDGCPRAERVLLEAAPAIAARAFAAGYIQGVAWDGWTPTDDEAAEVAREWLADETGATP